MNNIRKILILANDTTYTYNLRDVLLKTFISEGYKVIVACEKKDHVDEILSLGVQLIEIKLNRRSKNPFSDFHLYSRFRRILKDEKPSVVLTYNIKPNIYGGIACRITRIPYIPNITGLGTAVKSNGPIQKLTTILYRIGISKAACVMFQNEDNRRFFIDHKLLGKNSRTRILPGSGVNLEKFVYQTYPEADSPVVFSIIGRIMKDKGINELLEAAEIVNGTLPKTRFRLIGYFDENYQSMVMNAVNNGIVEYIGEQEDVRPFIKDSWAIIQPSHHEGMSNVLLESAATGRPVIATDIPGCREAFDNGISGFAFSVGNANALANAIVRFINLPYEDKLRMGKAGRLKMEKEFDRNIVAQEYLSEIHKTEEMKWNCIID